jgi:hypothetical protein
MRVQYQTTGYRILEWKYSKNVIEHFERMLGAPPNKLAMQIVFGDDTPDRQANTRRNQAL